MLQLHTYLLNTVPPRPTHTDRTFLLTQYDEDGRFTIESEGGGRYVATKADFGVGISAIGIVDKTKGRRDEKSKDHTRPLPPT